MACCNVPRCNGPIFHMDSTNKRCIYHCNQCSAKGCYYPKRDLKGTGGLFCSVSCFNRTNVLVCENPYCNTVLTFELGEEKNTCSSNCADIVQFLEDKGVFQSKN
jgi:hypothetical protein